MKPGLSTTSLSSSTLAKISPHYQSNLLPQINPNSFFFLKSRAPLSCQTKPSPSRFRLTLCFSHSPNSPVANEASNTNLEKEALNADQDSSTSWRIEEGSPIVPSFVQPAAKLSLSDQAFFLLAFIGCTTSVAFTSLVIAAVPTLHAMGRAANSLSKLADTAREELPSTMAAIRLSGMEISDLTLELSDLSQEIAEGVNKSAQAVQAAEAGIRQIGSRARQQTLSMIEERANLPSISLQPVVVGAAKKTSRAVGQATKTFMNMISGGEGSSDNNNANAIERLEI